MTKFLSAALAAVTASLLAVVSASCDQVEKVASGVGGGSKTTAQSTAAQSGQDAAGGEDEVSDASEANGDDGSAALQVAQADTPQEPTKIRLNAFKDFNCSGGWTNRDGALGLRAGSGSGVCAASFPGSDGSYRVTLMAQLEFDGNPNFRIDVDGATVAAGSYPMSMGELICDCPNWRVNCPDRVVPIDAGVHDIRNGASIEFHGAEVYPCGGSHGAYAKWHELVFTPQD